MGVPVADYHMERAAFEALMGANCEQRILFFRGESGSGKTTLLSNCRDLVRQARISYVNIDLKGTGVTIGEILSRTSKSLPEAQLPNLTQMASELEGHPEVDLENIRQSGLGNKINITLQVSDPHDREQRRVALTDALFADLRTFTKPVLFILDTYQDATTEVRDWISGPFLARLETATPVRAVIAGQTLPEESNLDWGHCCSSYHLKGVPKPEHWLPVVEWMGLQIPGSDALSWLNPICDLLQGRPSEIMKYLKAHQARSLQT